MAFKALYYFIIIIQIETIWFQVSRKRALYKGLFCNFGG